MLRQTKRNLLHLLVRCIREKTGFTPEVQNRQEGIYVLRLFAKETHVTKHKQRGIFEPLTTSGFQVRD